MVPCKLVQKIERGQIIEIAKLLLEKLAFSEFEEDAEKEEICDIYFELGSMLQPLHGNHFKEAPGMSSLTLRVTVAEYQCKATVQR